MKTVRCFLAVNLDLKTANKLSALQQNLIADTVGFKSGFKWVPPQNMHITVRFLGNITEPMIQAIKDTMEKITNTFTPFAIETGAVGAFHGDTATPILYCEIKDPSGELTRLVQQIHSALENIGFKELDKPWTPHVTLARVSDAEGDEIQKLISSHAEVEHCESSIKTLVCYQSILLKPGADYQLLWKLPLQNQIQSKEHDEYPEENLTLCGIDEEAEYTGTSSETKIVEYSEGNDFANSAEEGEDEQ